MPMTPVGTRDEGTEARTVPADSTLQYHFGEWEIARNPAHPNHALPKIRPEHRRILDIGCGMGQSLLALQSSNPVEAWGIDRDAGALSAGARIGRGTVRLIAGTGESLPFPDRSFDLVFSRVALPYMDLSRAIGEAARVLRPGGEFWAMLHPPGVLSRRIGADIRSGRVKDLVLCGYIGVNSLLLHCFKRQLRVRGSCETVQTSSGMRRLLDAGGFQTVSISRAPHFIVRAHKA